MSLGRIIAGLVVSCLPIAISLTAQAAEKYPVRPVRFVIPFPPGGGNDILLGTNTTLAVVPSLRTRLPYDSIKDYDAISLMSSSPYLLVVNPGFAATTVKELIALAKAKPGQINYASPGFGTSNHLSFELFKSMAGIDLTHVPYKGTGPALTELLGGQVPVMLASTASVRPLVLAGKLRALGISTAKRSPAMPDVAPIAESGVPGFDNASWVGLISPRGTPQQFAQHIRSELERFRKLVKAAGIPVE